MVLYELAILGNPTTAQLDELTKWLDQAAEHFQLKINVDNQLF